MKEIINIRIDERLIHGQVATVWTHTLSATRIMIVDDEVIKNDMQKSLLKMACPSGVKLSILSAGKAAANLLSGKYAGERIFMVLKKPETLLSLWENGFHMEEVNVGNMSGGPGTVQLKKAVCATPENMKTFQTLAARGVHFTAQMVPNDEPLELMDLIRKKLDEK